MSQRTPKICQPYGKVVIPIEDGECLFWLIPVDSVEDIENPTRDFAWITPDGIFYVFDGKKIVPINDPNTLKVQFQNVLGNPYDNGNLANALNEKVNGIRMNDRTVPMGTNGIVDLGCITTCEDLEQAIAGIETMHAEIVEELPETGDEQTIYLIPKELEPEYVTPCHTYRFTEHVVEGTVYGYQTETYVTPNNELPIVAGQNYIVTVDGEDYSATGSINGGIYEVMAGNTATLTSYQNLPATSDEEWSFEIYLSELPEGAEKVDDGWNIDVCVSKLQDTVYEMYLWIDGEYRFIGAKPISVDTDKDWNVNNPNSVEYIKNRTHYTDDNGTVHTLDDKYLSSNVAMKSDLPQYQSIFSRTTKTIASISANSYVDATTSLSFTIPTGFRYHACRSVQIIPLNQSTTSRALAVLDGFGFSADGTTFDVRFNAYNNENSTKTNVQFKVEATLELVKV